MSGVLFHSQRVVGMVTMVGMFEVTRATWHAIPGMMAETSPPITTIPTDGVLYQPPDLSTLEWGASPDSQSYDSVPLTSIGVEGGPDGASDHNYPHEAHGGGAA